MKTFVYFKNSFCRPTQKEYLGFDLKNNKMIGYQHPQFAQIFSSKKAAENMVSSHVVRNNDVLYGHLEELEDDLVVFDNWVKNGCQYRASFLVDNDLSKPYNGESALEVLEWYKIHQEKTLEGINNIRYEDYCTWPKLFQKFECLQELISYENGQKTVSMRVLPTTDFDTFLEEFDLVNDCIQYRPRRYPDAFYVDVFEHTLSEFQSIGFYIFDDGSYAVGSDFNPVRFNSLEECFNYWKKNHWYSID